MRLSASLPVFTLTSLSSALPSQWLQQLSPRQANISLPTIEVTNFRAFMADPYFEGAQSNLTFHVKDPRPAPFGAEADCTIPNTYFHLFAISALFDWCGSDWREHGFSYRYNEGGLTVRRAWYADESTYVQGSATKQPMWSETGPEANVTKYPSGKYYIRDEVWEFPITRTSPATPP